MTGARGGSPPGRPGAMVAALLLLASACAGVGGVRPRYGALPQAAQTTIDGGPTAITQLIDNTVRGAGLQVTAAAAREGYVETAWFEIGSRRPVSLPFTNMDRVVKLRFFVDPSQGRTRIVAECVYRIAWDPSVPARELERMVPDDHPGRLLLDSIVAIITPPPAARRPPLQ